MPSAVTGSQLCHLKGGRCSPVWLLSQTSQLWAFPSVSPLAKCKQALCVSTYNELRCLIELYGFTFVQILNHFADSRREPWVLEHMVKIHKCLLHDVKEKDWNELEGMDVLWLGAWPIETHRLKVFGFFFFLGIYWPLLIQTGHITSKWSTINVWM